MALQFQPISATQVFTMSAWCYPPPYEIYNLVYPPPAEDVAYWLDPVNQVHAILDRSGLLVAFCSFGEDGQVPGGDYTAPALDMGMGVRPDLTGQGKGANFADAVCEFARQSILHQSLSHQPLPSQPLRVTIASKNVRAHRTWSKVGFRPVQQFLASKTEMAFDILIREGS